MVFRVAAAGRAVAARQGAGDGVYQGGSRSHLDCNPRGGAAHVRTNRLCSRAFILGLSPYPPSLGEFPSSVFAMAAHLSHTMERPTDFFAANCGFLSRRGVGVLVDAATARARSALEQFLLRGITRTKNRTGVLIFVSLAEHYARIVADEGISRKVHHSEWQAAVDALTARMHDDQIAAGFIAAIERCGVVLATHAPPDGSPNELPDRLYVI